MLVILRQYRCIASQILTARKINCSKSVIIWSMIDCVITLKKIIDKLYQQQVDVQLTRPDPKFGDFATNVALHTLILNFVRD